MKTSFNFWSVNYWYIKGGNHCLAATCPQQEGRWERWKVLPRSQGVRGWDMEKQEGPEIGVGGWWGTRREGRALVPSLFPLPAAAAAALCTALRSGPHNKPVSQGFLLTAVSSTCCLEKWVSKSVVHMPHAIQNPERGARGTRGWKVVNRDTGSCAQRWEQKPGCPRVKLTREVMLQPNSTCFCLNTFPCKCWFAKLSCVSGHTAFIYKHVWVSWKAALSLVSITNTSTAPGVCADLCSLHLWQRPGP